MPKNFPCGAGAVMTGSYAGYAGATFYQQKETAAMEISLLEKPEIDVHSLALLRRSVGWEAQVERLSQTADRIYYWAGSFAAEKLIGYIEVVSDGVDDAYIRNLIVHPHYQRRGIGLKLLKLALARINADGIKMTNVLFKPELSAFYRKAGFKIISGGIIDNHCHNLSSDNLL